MATEVSMRLPNKSAIVTGGGKGIGREIALALAQEGAHVLVAGRQSDVLEQTASEINSLGRRSVFCITDVSDESQVERMVSTALEAFGDIDILVNNAGITGPTTAITSVTRDEWDEVIAINLTGPFLCARAVAPHMIARGSGKIV